MAARAPQRDRRSNPHTTDDVGPTSGRVRVAWLLTAVCAAAIWTLGTDPFSADQTSRFFGPFLHFAFPDLSEAQHLFWLGALRKAAHVVEYSVFALLAARALFMSVDWEVKHVALAALLLTATLSGSDELRQTFSPVRTGTLRDVGIDLTAAATSLGLFFALQRATGRSWVDRRGGRPSYWPTARRGSTPEPTGSDTV